MAAQEPTISFSIAEDREKEVKKILTTVYEALRQNHFSHMQLEGDLHRLHWK